MIGECSKQSVAQQNLDRVDLSLTADEKLSIAKRYVTEIVRLHPDLQAVIASGSTVRGNAVPPSDVDMWYVIHEGHEAAGIRKGIYGGVAIDIEPYPPEGQTLEGLLSDAYLLGYVFDAAVLHDRTGAISDLIQRVRPLISEPEYKAIRLSKLAGPTKRNLKEFRQSIVARDAPEACRASSFAVWCLADYLLARADKSPGGFRVLSRLRTESTSLFDDLTYLQGSRGLGKGQVQRLVDLYAHLVAADQLWLGKIGWMLDHGLEHEAFQNTSISLGLAIKQQGNDPGKVTETCQAWLQELG